MLVAGKVNDEQVDDELSDLHGGEVSFPPDLGSSSSGVVVIVHDHMHSQVQGNDDPLDTGLTVQLVVAEDGGSGVVEDVKECQLLLLQHQEHRVNQLEVLEVVVDNVEGDESRSERPGVANGPEESVLQVKGYDLFQHENQQEQRSGREEDVVDLEEGLKFEGGS